MLDHIIRFSLKHRAAVAALAVVIAVWGGFASLRLPIDVLPDLNRPTVTVLTESHGLLPVDVERLVTLPIERAVNGATGVTRVRSASGVGLSVVWVEFGWDSDVYRNRQLVQERLQLAQNRLPEDVEPQLTPVSSLMGQVQLLGVRSAQGDMPIDEVRAWVDQQLRPQLLSLPGVAQVVASGGAARQLQVILDLPALRDHGVSVEEVVTAVRRANKNGGGGVLEMGARGPMVNVTGALSAGDQLRRAVVRADPERPLVLADLGEVRFGPAAVRTGSAGVDGEDGVIVAVVKQPGADTVAVSEVVEGLVVGLEGTLPGDLAIEPGLYRQADFIHRGIENVSEAVWLGALLVVLVVFLFQLNLRSTLITLTAIPLSIAVTALVFALFGFSVNTMTLGGLAVAVGALVDDAIVDVENVFRRLRRNHLEGAGRPPLAVVFRASSEVRKPILIGTLVVCAVYVPLFALTGMEGRLFAPIGVTYIVSILASLLVALTVTPALCSWLLVRAPSLMRDQDTPAVRHLRAVAAVAIRFGMRHSGRLILLALALVVAALLALSGRGTEFLPAFNEGTAQVNLTLPPETSLTTSTTFGRKVEEAILSVDGVSSVARRTGRAEEDEHAHGVNASEVLVSFDPEAGRGRAELIDDLRHTLEHALPGMEFEVEQPLGHMISHLLSGVAAQVAIKIQGPDLVQLREIAVQVEHAVEGVPGVADLFREPQVLVRQVEVRPDRAALAAHGLTVQDIADTAEYLLEGAAVDRLRLGTYGYPIIVQLAAADRVDMEALRRLPLVRDGETAVALGDVAWVGLSRTPNSINREDGLRRIVVQHNISERSLGEVVGGVQQALQPIRESLPDGYSIHIGGQYEAQQESARWIGLLSLVSLLAIALLVFAHFQSLSLTLQALADIPMAAIGAVSFLVLTDQTVSVATLVGFISLGGIAVRNKILLLDHYLHLMREEGAAFGADMIVRAGQERVVPVLMTALTSGIALVPLVLSPDHPGRELLYPVASVIVGGLISTTLMDLLLTPALFWRFGRKGAEASVARAQQPSTWHEAMGG